MRAVPTSRLPRTRIRWRWLAVAARRRRGARVAGRADAERARPAHHARHADVHAGAVSARRRRRSRVAAGAARDLRGSDAVDRRPGGGDPRSHPRARRRRAGADPDRLRRRPRDVHVSISAHRNRCSRRTIGRNIGTSTGHRENHREQHRERIRGLPGAPSLLPPATLRFTGDVPAGARAVPRHLRPGPRVVRADAGEPGGTAVRADLDRRRTAEPGARPARRLRRSAVVDDGRRIRRPRLHAHPAQGPRSHPVRGRPVPARHALASAAAAGHALHDRALGHARPVDAGHRVAAVVDRRAADRASRSPTSRSRTCSRPSCRRGAARSSSCSACCTASASPASSASSACRAASSGWRWSRSTSASSSASSSVIALAALAVGWWRLSQSRALSPLGRRPRQPRDRPRRPLLDRDPRPRLSRARSSSSCSEHCDQRTADSLTMRSSAATGVLRPSRLLVQR